MAVSLGFTAPAVAVKLAVEDPGETKTKGGTVTPELLLARVTIPPSVWGMVTVQVLEEPDTNVDGIQVTDRTPGAVVRLRLAASQDAPSATFTLAD